MLACFTRQPACSSRVLCPESAAGLLRSAQEEPAVQRPRGWVQPTVRHKRAAAARPGPAARGGLAAGAAARRGFLTARGVVLLHSRPPRWPNGQLGTALPAARAEGGRAGGRRRRPARYPSRDPSRRSNPQWPRPPAGRAAAAGAWWPAGGAAAWRRMVAVPWPNRMVVLPRNPGQF